MGTIRKIGFTKQYYTIWDISSDVVYSGTQGNYTANMVTHYNYIQNLSMDLDKAIEKAKEMGATNLVVDEDLFGRNSSWSNGIRLDCKMPNNLSPFFEFGKYRDKLINEVDDLDYCKWYLSETSNIYCKSILLKNGFKQLGGYIVTPEEYEEEMNKEYMRNVMSQKDSVEVLFNKNLSFSGGSGCITLMVDGYQMFFVFPEYKEMDYQGFTYASPLINGKAKRIKNKAARLFFKEVQDGFRLEYHVSKIELI